MTGQHIQGMALVEAARQMMLAVSENFLLEPHLVAKSYFVLNDIQIKFERFVFPLPCEIDYQLTDVKISKHGTLTGVGRAIFKQNGQIVSDISISYSSYPKSFIGDKEEALARSAVTNTFAQIKFSMANGQEKRERV